MAEHSFRISSKSMVFIIIVLFVGSGIIPSISGVIDVKTSDSENSCEFFQYNMVVGEVESLFVTLEAAPYNFIDYADGKTEIDMVGFGSILISGYPKLPSKTFLVGVPPGAEVVSVKLVKVDCEVIPGCYDVISVPLASNNVDDVRFKIDEEVYFSSDSHPSDIYEFLGMGQLRKYSFARVRFCPMVYSPSTGELILYKEITLKIEFRSIHDISDELLSDTVMDDVASEIIVNYPSIRSFYVPSFSACPTETYTYLIITTSSLENSVKFLKNWKELIGYSVKVVNVSWIYSNYAGSDEQESIRNFLIDKYASWGIEYVLIVGSHDEIPMRYCCYPASSDNALLTDYYYADLTGDWDSDGDGIYGEEYEDSLDFNPETYVGRIPIDTPSIIENICQKTIDFERDTGTWKKQTLLLGAIINFENEVGLGNPMTDGAALMEKLWTDVYSPNGYSRTAMYEKDGLRPTTYSFDYPLNRENVLDRWQDGYGIVNWGSHGSADESSRKWWANDNNLNNVPDFNEISKESFISSYDTIALNDDKPSIVFSCACNNAAPENPNNLGKALLENGAVAFVGATHKPFYFYGWDHENDGGSISIDYFFFKYLINLDYTCAEALYNSLSYCWNNDEIPSVYRNMLIFCLYGDPSISFKTFTTISPPNTPSKPSGPESITPLVKYTYSTIASNSEGHQLYYLWDWGDGSETEPLGPYEPGEIVETQHEWKIAGDYRIRVRALGITGDESSWSEPLIIHVKGPVIKIESITGGIKINAVIKNIGDAEANGVKWNITFYGGSILLGKYTSGTISSISAGGKTTVISRLIYGLGFPTVVIVEAGIPGSSSDIEVQSADVILFLIRIK